jgi:REP element-mobilizing transposase RayT
MNRGIAKRTIAENARDAECFFARLTEVVDAGLVAIEAAVLMGTHFHLLLCSLVGEFWRAMRQFQNGHARAFNRARRRDGPLFRGRFRSRHIDAEAYWLNVVRYIDHNPVAARMVSRPEDHPYGSAHHFTLGSHAPWLDREPVELFVQGWTGASSLGPDDYRGIFGVAPAAPALIERRLLHGGRDDNALGRLLPATPGRTLDWMTWKANLADGTSPGCPVSSPGTVDVLLAAAAARDPEQRVRLRRNSVSTWPLIRIGLLRTACGLTLSEIAARVGANTSTVHQRVRTHDEVMRADEAYAQQVAAILCEALEVDWRVGGTPRRSGHGGGPSAEPGAEERAR